MEIKYNTDKPKNLTEEQLHYFLKLLKLQGQVANPSIEKLLACTFLCLAYHNEFLVGIGAIKDVYKTPFDKANVSELKDKYDIELGYIFVLDKKEYRGQKIAKSICAALLNKVGHQNVFSTTEESDENAMKWILQKFHFFKAGQSYVGAKTKKNIGLYLLTNVDTEKNGS